MEIWPNDINSTCLELTIAIPGFSHSPSFPPSGESGTGGAIKELDMNQVDCMEEKDDDDDGGGPNNSPAPRKKLRLTKEQSRFLEESFLQNHTLNPKEKEALAMELNLKTRQVEVWFQNRRARSKMKQTEMECEYLKKWLGTLTEQNKRLRKEVEELRAIPSMCPRCERLAAGNTPAADGVLLRNHA